MTIVASSLPLSRSLRSASDTRIFRVPRMDMRTPAGGGGGGGGGGII